MTRLAPEAVALARAVALLGDGCELRQARELAGLAEVDVAAALATLIAHGVLP